MVRVELPRGYSEPGVYTVAPLVRSNSVPLRRVLYRADDGSPDHGVGMTPRDGDGVDAECVGVGGQVDEVNRGEVGEGDSVLLCGRGEGGWRGLGWGRRCGWGTLRIQHLHSSSSRIRCRQRRVVLGQCGADGGSGRQGEAS